MMCFLLDKEMAHVVICLLRHIAITAMRRRKGTRGLGATVNGFWA